MLLCQKSRGVKRKQIESVRAGKNAAHLARARGCYCGVGLFTGDAALPGVGLATGDALAAGDGLGETDGFGETYYFGVGDGVAAAAGFLTGTVTEATSCHCPLRRANVSTDRNS